MQSLETETEILRDRDETFETKTSNNSLETPDLGFLV